MIFGITTLTFVHVVLSLVGSAVVALYLNVFVLIAQAFLKVPALKALAPTQTEPPFLVTELIALAIFVALAIAAVIRFRSDVARTADRHPVRAA